MKTIDVTGTPFQDELERNENVVWVGRPEPSVLFTTADFWLVPFSLAWGGFVVASVLSSLGGFGPAGRGKGNGLIEPSLYAVAGLFLMIALNMIIGRFFYKIWKKKRTWYAVTNRRILILRDGAFAKNVQGVDLRLIPAIHKLVRKDGVGTLRFGNVLSPVAAMYANTGLDVFATGPQIPTFHDIADAEEVYRLVVAAKR
jgi:hypothetical protein